MKNREEYIESIYKKRDEALKLRKKQRSYFTAAACIAVCFLTAFFLVPQSKPEIKDKPNHSLVSTLSEVSGNITTEDFATVLATDGTFGVIEEFDDLRVNKSEAFFEESEFEEADKNEAFLSTRKVLNISPPLGDYIPECEGAEDSVPKATMASKQPDASIGNTDYSADETIVFNINESPDSLPKTDYSPANALNEARKYINEEDLEATDIKHPTIYVEYSNDKYHYRVCFTTDKSTVNIKLDYLTLEFLSREEQPIE